jgi:hypothetical protein
MNIQETLQAYERLSAQLELGMVPLRKMNSHREAMRLLRKKIAHYLGIPYQCSEGLTLARRKML